MRLSALVDSIETSEALRRGSDVIHIVHSRLVALSETTSHRRPPI
jgi:hypothetical protein